MNLLTPSLLAAIDLDDCLYRGLQPLPSTVEYIKEHGGLTAANGQAFREQVLSRGNSVELARLYRDFRGKDPSVEPLLENRGLK